LFKEEPSTVPGTQLQSNTEHLWVCHVMSAVFYDSRKLCSNMTKFDIIQFLKKCQQNVNILYLPKLLIHIFGKIDTENELIINVICSCSRFPSLTSYTTLHGHMWIYHLICNTNCKTFLESGFFFKYILSLYGVYKWGTTWKKSSRSGLENWD
jgi:hypothetical protein